MPSCCKVFFLSGVQSWQRTINETAANFFVRFWWSHHELPVAFSRYYIMLSAICVGFSFCVLVILFLLIFLLFLCVALFLALCSETGFNPCCFRLISGKLGLLDVMDFLLFFVLLCFDRGSLLCWNCFVLGSYFYLFFSLWLFYMHIYYFLKSFSFSCLEDSLLFMTFTSSSSFLAFDLLRFSCRLLLPFCRLASLLFYPLSELSLNFLLFFTAFCLMSCLLFSCLRPFFCTKRFCVLPSYYFIHWTVAACVFG